MQGLSLVKLKVNIFYIISGYTLSGTVKWVSGCFVLINGAGHDHAQVVSAQAVVQLETVRLVSAQMAGLGVMRSSAPAWPRHAAAGEESTWNVWDPVTGTSCVGDQGLAMYP